MREKLNRNKPSCEMSVSDCFSFQLYSFQFCKNTHQTVLFMSALYRKWQFVYSLDDWVLSF